MVKGPRRFPPAPPRFPLERAAGSQSLPEHAGTGESRARAGAGERARGAMFYDQSLLSRKGPLGCIWVAAHCYKKLRKEQVTETDISSAIEKIIPEVQLSYRVLAHLLLGVVRIFSKKVDYLFHDCSKILIRLGETFLTGQLDTSKEATAAHHHEFSTPKEATHGQHHRVVLHEKDICVFKEAIRAANHGITFTLPKSFELDSFDLQIPEEDENVRIHDQLRVEVEDEHNQNAFMNERCNDEMIVCPDFYSGCFTPVEDVISCGILDIDPEVGGLLQTSRSEAKQGLQSDLPPLGECGNHLSARASLQLNMNSQELGEQPEQNELQQSKLSDPSYPCPEGYAEVRTSVHGHSKMSLHKSDPSHAPLEGYAELGTPVNRHSKMSLPCAPEAAAPEFAVNTPAIKERHRVSRKRKCLCDETVVLSNQTLRQWIHDASSLICKRRKAPHTFLDAWQAEKISNIKNSLTENLIPCIAFDFNAIFLEGSFFSSPQKHSADSTSEPSFQKTEMLAEAELRDALLEGRSVEGLPSVSSVDQSCEPNFEKTEMLAEPELGNGLLGKPSAEVLPSVSSAEVPSAVKADEEIFEESFDIEKSDIDTSFGESSSLKGENKNQDGWSTKTRSVACYLSSCYEQGKGALNLSKILERKRRMKCAKFFYEVLVLKCHGYVDVRQDLAFGEIIISVTPAMKTMLRSNCA